MRRLPSSPRTISSPHSNFSIKFNYFDGSYKFLVCQDSSSYASELKQNISLSFEDTIDNPWVTAITKLSKILGEEIFEHHSKGVNVAVFPGLLLLFVNEYLVSDEDTRLKR